MYESSFSRLFGVFVSPERTFQSVRERPAWVLPLVLMVVLGLGLGLVVHERTDYREVTERALEARNVDMTATEVDDVVAQQESLSGIFIWLSPIFIVFMFLLGALYFWVGCKLVGSELSFGQSFATYVYGSLPTGVMMLLAIPVVWVGGTLSYERLTTRNFLASNLGFLAPEGDVLVGALLTGIDFFVLWSTVLLAIGYRVVARVSRTTAITLVTIFFLLGLALRMAGAWLGGGGS